MADQDEVSEQELWVLASDENEYTRADALAELASRLHGREQYSEAVSPAGVAKELFAKLGVKPAEGRVSFLEGVILAELGRHADAILSFDNAAEIYRIHENETVLADALMKRAQMRQHLDDFDGAVNDYRSASSLYSSNEKATSAGICLLDLGEYLGLKGQQSAALEEFRTALKVFREGADMIGAGRAHDRAAAALIDLSDLDAAISHLRESLNIFEYLTDELRTAYARYRLGWTLVMKGEGEEAIPLLRQAVATYKSSNRFVEAANVDLQLAHALAYGGEEAEALSLYRQIKSIYEAAGDRSSALIAEASIASTLMQTDLDQAIEILRRVLDAAEELEIQWMFEAITVRLANTLFHLKTQEAYQEALDLLGLIQEKDWGENLGERAKYHNAMARSLIELGRHAEAEPHIALVTGLGLESGMLLDNAEAHELLAALERERNNDELADQVLARSIALYLAGGDGDTAKRLSNRLLPKVSANSPDSIASWRAPLST